MPSLAEAVARDLSLRRRAPVQDQGGRSGGGGGGVGDSGEADSSTLDVTSALHTPNVGRSLVGGLMRRVDSLKEAPPPPLLVEAEVEEEGDGGGGYRGTRARAAPSPSAALISNGLKSAK